MLISEQIDREVDTLRPVFKDYVTAVRFVFRNEPALLRSFLPKAINTNKWKWI
ncbi:hypothetical protein OKW21_003851 [Catalinimonas alkaloidigena]|uniref:hypothetical protein n=1 Tax=Catalinimonas alkaloidigena TaxID=1075417 RepID=UPI002406F82E|nr:hypothetical protein [Catalinimonas alkaloidigena]MDF9798588.1 hypothetical protein [Catalinimonas alkaloidigena]